MQFFSKIVFLFNDFLFADIFFKFTSLFLCFLLLVYKPSSKRLFARRFLFYKKRFSLKSISAGAAAR